MVRSVRVAGSPVTLLRGTAFPAETSFLPANDNGSRSDAMTVTVRRKLEKSGFTVKIKVPVEEYVGVAVATRISEDGALTSAIELIHPNTDFNYAVFEEEGNGNVVAEWQNWGKKLRLPLYIRAGNGDLVPYSQQVGGVQLGHQTGRRMLSAEAERRTRFTRRRKPGEISA